MKKSKNIGLDFEIDKLTNSIENVITGDSFATEISIVIKSDLKVLAKRSGWLFNWKEEFKQPKREVYKLTIVGNPKIVQGLICFEIKQDHVYIHIIENAPFNKEKIKCIQVLQGTW